jgi:hypothetical protein
MAKHSSQSHHHAHCIKEVFHFWWAIMQLKYDGTEGASIQPFMSTTPSKTLSFPGIPPSARQRCPVDRRRRPYHTLNL